MLMALRKLVFPLAVPPDMSRLISFSMQSHTSDAISEERCWLAIIAVMVHGFFPNFLMVMVLPFCDIGYRVALTLDPSGSSASMSGARLVICLPTLLPICSALSYIIVSSAIGDVRLAPAELLVVHPHGLLGGVDRDLLEVLVGERRLQVAEAEHDVYHVGYEHLLRLLR